jgi:hypothetical protein
MYCSDCGVTVARGLSYCNHCGAQLNAEKGDSVIKTSELKAESLIISAMVGIFVLGLVAITVLMGVMKAVLDFNEALIIAFTLLSFLIMLFIEGVLIWRLARHNRNADQTGDNAALSKKRVTNELEVPQTRVLPEAMPSVTDHTTRQFEPVYIERKSK